VNGGTGDDIIRTSATDTIRGKMTIDLSSGGRDTVQINNAQLGNTGVSYTAGPGGYGGPIVDEESLTNPFEIMSESYVGGGTNTTYVVVRVTNAGHQIANAESVTLSTGTGFGGISAFEMSGTFTAANVVSLSTYEVTLQYAGDVTASIAVGATGGGSVTETDSDGHNPDDGASATMLNTTSLWTGNGSGGISEVVINGFTAGNGGDRVEYYDNGTRVTFSSFKPDSAVNSPGNTMSGLVTNSVIEISADWFQVADPNNLSAMAGQLDQLNNVADGTYFIVAYNGSTGADAKAFLYGATATEGDGFDFEDANEYVNGFDTDTLELLAVYNGVSANSLTSDNFIWV
jgi:hypothetical protein